MAEQAVSPMMQQYFEIKKQHPNEILFYRVGDFYEMFYDDALTASRELELTLTGKNCGKEERAPMCGVPFHSYETYMARLIAKGYKVAICEQMEDPALAKGLVKRDIIRVVTPGTVIESSMLSEDKNNYLASIYCRRTRGRWRAGVCFADISTGEAYATELNAEKIGGAIITELCRYMPSEILICPPMLDFKDVTTYIKQHTHALVELREDACFKDAVMESTMADQFGTDWRAALGYEKDALVPYAVAALLNYLHETQKHGVERIKTVQNYADAQYMRLSPVTRANLELTETMRGREKRGTLLWVLDKTETSMGKRLLRSWIEQPLVDAEAINARLCAVQALYTANMARADLKEALGHVFDIERLTTRILYGSATPREVKALGDTCAMLPQVKAQAAACGAVFESVRPRDYEIGPWLSGFIASKGCRIDEKALSMLTDHLGCDVSKIANELEKLLVSLPEGTQRITDRDIERNIGISREYNNFELCKAVLGRDMARALRIADHFGRNPKENPLLVTVLALFGQFRQLFVLNYLYWLARRRGTGEPSDAELMRALKVGNVFAINELRQAMPRWPNNKVFGVLGLLREYDGKSKGLDAGGASDGELLRELLLKMLTI